MHQQYTATYNIKFPDSRISMKAGDVLLYNCQTEALSIYRSQELVGTVHFSNAGLAEFQRLGWVQAPQQVVSPTPVIPVVSAKSVKTVPAVEGESPVSKVEEEVEKPRKGPKKAAE